MSGKSDRYGELRAAGTTPWAAAGELGISERSLGKYERAYQGGLRGPGASLTEAEQQVEAAQGRLHAAARRGRARPKPPGITGIRVQPPGGERQ